VFFEQIIDHGKTICDSKLDLKHTSYYQLPIISIKEQALDLLLSHSKVSEMWGLLPGLAEGIGH